MKITFDKVCSLLNIFISLINTSNGKQIGPVRESNPGPLAPKARIMPLDQQAKHVWAPFDKGLILPFCVELVL